MRIRSYPFIGSLLVCIGLHACTSLKPFYDKSQKNWETAHSPDTLRLKYSVFLVGDAGSPEKDKQEPALKLLQSQLFPKDTLITAGSVSDTVFVNSSHEEDVVIFLGDNIYEQGLPEPDASDRKEKERRIIAQMDVVKNFKGRSIVVPGNHDWNEGLRGGLAAINRQEQFIEQYLDSADVFLPSNGCGGPVELQLNKNLVVIVIDSEWWLHKYDKPLAPDNDCSSASRLDIIQQVEDIIVRNRGKHIVLAQHHPLFSNGRHGGYFTLNDYIFPLTLVRDNWWVPLPIIGSVYPLLRQYGVSRQDLSNKDYQQLKRGLLSVLGEEKNIVIATGHEHAMQLNKYKDINHVISGAGSKSTSMIKGNDALFAYGGGGAKGFARLNYYDNGQCWIEFWEPIDDGSTGKIVYRSPLYAIPSKNAETLKEEKLISYKDSTRTLVAGSQYNAGNFKRSLFGEHYRDTWATPINVKYLDMSAYAGGLTPLKMGGGKQTTSLQLQGKDGNIYQFRTVEKNPAALLPEGFLKTFAEDFVQDQISSAHPYGALIIPGMAKAIGIYHTNPELVYMPHSTLLGPYIQQVGGKLGIIEARPDEDVSDFKSFGNAKNAVSTNKMYQELREDNDNEVDQEMFLRSRLFDLLIGDWDRHEDQWRWAEFKKEKGSLFRPIPRDRDQAFTKFDGIIPGFASYMLPDIQSFKSEMGNPAEMSIAARNLDRNLLNKLTLDKWKEIAADIQTKLTDEVIETAVSKMPQEVFKSSGQEIIDKLKSRRSQLLSTAEEYYHVLAKEVTVPGTDKKEFFNVNRSPETTQVSVYKIDKDEKVDNKIYDRVFKNSETGEINLYGLNGKDSIIIAGSGNGIKIRAVGGQGKDALIDKGEGGRTLFYDQNTEDNNIEKGEHTALRLSDKSWINDYDPNSFVYDKKAFKPFFDYNSDDGLFIGGGYQIKHYGFRKEPYSYDQSLVGNFAPKTSAHVIQYRGNFYSLFAKNLDLIVHAAYNGPKYTFNYFGQGNSSLNVGDDIDFFRVRTHNISFATILQRRFTKAFKVGIGPGFELYRVEKPENTFVTSPFFPEKEDIEHPAKFLSLRTIADINYVNNNIFPNSGVRLRTEANYFNEIKNEADRFLQLKANVSFYATPNFNFPVTAAFRLGGARNFGDYKFYQANSLGNNTNLRGFRNNRFTGHSYLYQNSELRFKLTNFRNYIFTGNLGAFAFFDSGRVYSDNPEESTWHKGYGPGLWINLYNKFLLSSSFGMSKEGNYLTLKSGMTF
ncbi:BamA/TamA family outer membrane protein [Flavihumibacter sp. R14]|nr:BamA/TamA family outer membrane protein [Flavihumibacter soli]